MDDEQQEQERQFIERDAPFNWPPFAALIVAAGVVGACMILTWWAHAHHWRP